MVGPCHYLLQEPEHSEYNMVASTTLQEVLTNAILHEKDSKKLHGSSYTSLNVIEPNVNDFVLSSGATLSWTKSIS